MAFDLRLVQLEVPIEVREWRIPSPGVLRVSGKSGSKSSSFFLATDVVVDGRSLPFSVVSSRTLEVSIPTSWSEVSQVQVWGAGVIPDLTQRISLRLGSSPSLVGGTEMLVQQFIMQLWKDPGSDVFNPADGGGLMRIYKASVNMEARALAGEVSDAVRRAARQIIGKQRGQVLPADQRLAAAEVLSVDSQSVTIRLYTLSGQTDFRIVPA